MAMALQGSIRSDNMDVYLSMKPGDCITFKRGVYYHWAVCADDRMLVHLAADDGDINLGAYSSASCWSCSGIEADKAVVRRDTFSAVERQSKAEIDNSKDSRMSPLPSRRIVRNALSKIGSRGYNVIWNNCEHFASWCRYGVEVSDQVNNAAAGLVAGVLGGAALGGACYLLYKALKTDEEEEKEERRENKGKELGYYRIV